MRACVRVCVWCKKKSVARASFKSIPSHYCVSCCVNVCVCVGSDVLLSEFACKASKIFRIALFKTVHQYREDHVHCNKPETGSLSVTAKEAVYYV